MAAFNKKSSFAIIIVRFLIMVDLHTYLDSVNN